MDFTAIIDQIVSYMTNLFASFQGGTGTESTVINTVTEYINGVIEGYSSAGLGINTGELRSSIVDSIKDAFKNTENEDLANKAAEETGKETSDSAYSFSRNKIPTSVSRSSILVINNHDYSSNIIMPTWKVNAKDIYEEKTNANKKFIRTVTRTRIMGNFTVAFNDTSTYAQFVSDLWNCKGSNGEVPCKLWVNNMLSNVSTNAYFTYESQNQIPQTELNRFTSFEVTVEEQ